MTTGTKEADSKTLTVTEGNIAFDKDGRKRLAGDDIQLTAAQAATLKKAKIVE
jgi:hypothetical protein